LKILPFKKESISLVLAIIKIILYNVNLNLSQVTEYIFSFIMLNFIDLIDSLFNGLERNIIRQERKNALDLPV
jgi:hypothetical protein